MSNDSNAPSWNGRKIAKDEDKHDLESRAAVYEFKHRMARPDAEHRAHHEYKQDKHREAAAYHMQGLKAAQAAGSHEEGHKHGMMYQLHMKELGLDPMGAVPHEIQGLADKQENFYRFKAHRGDAFLLQDKPAKEEDKGKLAKAAGYSMRDNLQQKGARPFKAGQSVYMTSHTGEKFPYTITSNEYKMMRYMDHAHPHVHVRSQTNSQDGGGWYPLAALHFEDGLAKAEGEDPNKVPARRLGPSKGRCDFCEHPSKELVGHLRNDEHQRVCTECATHPKMKEHVVLDRSPYLKKGELAKADGKAIPMKPKTPAAPAALPAKPATVTPIAPKQEARKALARTKVQSTFEDAAAIMGSDPGFQEAARQRETEAKKAKLKAGGQLYRPGQTVTHVDQQSVPWQGKVTSANYREQDIDGPGHYYEVKWWNPKLKQYHEDYLHQDNLKPG